MKIEEIYWAAGIISVEVLLVILLFFLYRYIKNKSAKKDYDPNDLSMNDELRDSLLKYITREIDRTKGILTVKNGSESYDANHIDNLPFGLRLQYLQLEKYLVKYTPQRFKNSHLEQKLNWIVKNCAAVIKQASNPELPEESNLRGIIEEQTHTIEFLKKYSNDILLQILQQNEGQEDVDIVTALDMADVDQSLKDDSQELFRKLEELEANSMEMNTNIAILEDENQFLRNQISELLSLK